ncbi:c-type cytochrome [Psychrobacter urativorans]|uniref:c-type cytochrome n=1 Tax=Psychrobacter urativorans TaxID=45610 RepID=UPI000A7DFAE5|nr:c-type cytochrome [Psychrobacter urativorans]
MPNISTLYINQPYTKKLQISTVLVVPLMVISMLTLSACKRTPPDYREVVTLPLYTEGDADKGALIYEDACGQCHQLNPGSNKKGPQLMNIYGAPAAELADYNYSDELIASGWVWDAKTLDPYIADTEKAMPGSKMLADPMPNASERADVIAYLSTLRAAIPELDAEGFPVKVSADKGAKPDSTPVSKTKTERPQMSNEPVDVSSDPTQKPAADFQ